MVSFEKPKVGTFAKSVKSANDRNHGQPLVSAGAPAVGWAVVVGVGVDDGAAADVAAVLAALATASSNLCPRDQRLKPLPETLNAIIPLLSPCRQRK